MFKPVLAVLAAGLLCFGLNLAPIGAEDVPPPTPPATPPDMTTPKPSDTPKTVTETSGPGAQGAATDAAMADTVGVERGKSAKEMFGYSVRFRFGASAWFGNHFESVYQSSTSDLRGQASPDRIDWPKSLDAKLDSITVVPELEMCFGTFQYLRVQYYRFNFKGNSTAPKNEEYGDIHYPAGTPWKGKGYLDQIDILYEIALVKQPPMATRLATFEWRLGIGVKVVSYDFEIIAAGAGMFRYDPVGNTPVAGVHEKDAHTIPIPIASSYFEVTLLEAPKKLGFFLDTQWISTPKMVINGDSLFASLTDIKTGVVYYPWPNLYVQVGYRYWHVNMTFDESGGQGRQVNGRSTIAGLFTGLVFQF